MKIEASTVDEYFDKVPEDRKQSMNTLRKTIRDNLPEGFAEALSYGAPGYVVPHSIYPAGYHCKPEEPLPFIGLMNQKNYIGFYHAGLYTDEDLSAWFRDEYAKRCRYKLDMGKSCVRFKRMDDIPYDLITELVQKITVQEWIATYEERNRRDR